MQHDFVINTGNVNEYKYRILTEGVDYKQYLRNPVVLFMHERTNPKNRGSEVIGRCVKLFVKGDELIATIEFDEKDEFAKKIADKVENGFIRMASMSADVKSTSSDPELIKEGQVYETVTKCKLTEISIVDIGGNDDALKLSQEGKEIKLNKLNINKNDNMSHLKVIALALGLDVNSDESALSTEIQKLQLAKKTADEKVVQLSAELSAIKTTEATAIVEKAIQLGLIPEGLKDSQIKAFENDFDGQKAILSKVIGEKEADAATNSNNQTIKNVVLSGKGAAASGLPTQTFDYLQKHDSVKLSKIRKEQPDVYEQLAQDYAKGVRHSETK